MVDFSGVNGEMLLLDAAHEGWEKDSVSVLVNTLKVNHHKGLI